MNKDDPDEASFGKKIKQARKGVIGTEMIAAYLKQTENYKKAFIRHRDKAFKKARDDRREQMQCKAKGIKHMAKAIGAQRARPLLAVYKPV